MAADNAAAVAEDTHDAAVLPVGGTIGKGKFQDTQQVFHDVLRNLEFDVFRVFGANFSLLFHVGHKAWPRPGLKLVQQRRCVFCHRLTSS